MSKAEKQYKLLAPVHEKKKKGILNIVWISKPFSNRLLSFEV